MTKERLDKVLLSRGLVRSRSEAENWIKLSKVSVNAKPQTKPGYLVSNTDDIRLNTTERYVSRAGLKLASVAKKVSLDFADKTVLDVGSSTGGFTDFALQHGARLVYAVDVGTDQLHPLLRSDKRVRLSEKTDIRDYLPATHPDIVVIDVSFISLRDILPHIARISTPQTVVVAMVKPQFEAGREQVNKGVIKNDAIRRQILKDFEQWTKQYFAITTKADSEISGAKGNRERFYVLQPLA